MARVDAVGQGLRGPEARDPHGTDTTPEVRVDAHAPPALAPHVHAVQGVEDLARDGFVLQVGVGVCDRPRYQVAARPRIPFGEGWHALKPRGVERPLLEGRHLVEDFSAQDRVLLDTRRVGPGVLCREVERLPEAQLGLLLVGGPRPVDGPRHLLDEPFVECPIDAHGVVEVGADHVGRCPTVVLEVLLDPPRRGVGPVHEHDDHAPAGGREACGEGAGAHRPLPVAPVLGDVDQRYSVPLRQGHHLLVAPLVAVVHEDDLELVAREGLVPHPCQEHIYPAGAECVTDHRYVRVGHL